MTESVHCCLYKLRAEFLRLTNGRLDNIFSELDEKCALMLELLAAKKGKYRGRIQSELAALDVQMV